jgi:hypothetical protein
MDPILTTPTDSQTGFYRLLRGKFHRLVPKTPEHPTGYVTARLGEMFVPTANELAMHRSNFEGPLNPAEAAKMTQEESVETLAARELDKSMPAIRDAVRGADLRMLESLRSAEAKRKPAPRVKVLEMIDRRLTALRKANVA